MTATTKIGSPLTGRGNPRTGHRPVHKLGICPSTGLARYRDRHQARDAARAARRGAEAREYTPFDCPSCRGFHLERRRALPVVVPAAPSAPVPAFTASLPTRKRRYVLLDIENTTQGAARSAADVAEVWRVLREQAPGIAPHDHVVVGAGRGFARRYRAAIQGPNVRWVVGANGPDGADRALLAAIDLYAVARRYDELVIASGDHAFADVARRARALGLSVQVIVTESSDGRSSLSARLAEVATTRTLVRRTARPATARPADRDVLPQAAQVTAGRPAA